MLDPRPARTDLTSREFARILGGLLGGLILLGDLGDLREAVRWWAETDAAWQGFEKMKASPFIRKAMESVVS